MKKPNEQKMIRSFGLFVAAVCFLIGGYLSLSGPIRFGWLGVGAYFGIGGVLIQPILRPVFLVWMKIATGLNWFNTRLLLGLLYYLGFSLISLGQKLFGRDALHLSQPSDDSLWVSRPTAGGGDAKQYFRQF